MSLNPAFFRCDCKAHVRKKKAFRFRLEAQPSRFSRPFLRPEIILGDPLKGLPMLIVPGFIDETSPADDFQ